MYIFISCCNDGYSLCIYLYPAQCYHPFFGCDFLELHLANCHWPKPSTLLRLLEVTGRHVRSWPAASIASIGHLVVSFEIQASKGGPGWGGDTPLGPVGCFYPTLKGGW